MKLMAFLHPNADNKAEQEEEKIQGIEMYDTMIVFCSSLCLMKQKMISDV